MKECRANKHDADNAGSASPAFPADADGFAQPGGAVDRPWTFDTMELGFNAWKFISGFPVRDPAAPCVRGNRVIAPAIRRRTAWPAGLFEYHVETGRQLSAVAGPSFWRTAEGHWNKQQERNNAD